MRFEIRRKVGLKAHQLRRIVGVFFPAFVTAHRQTEVDHRRWCKCIGLAQRNLVPAEEIFLTMEFIVFANDGPAIRFLLTPSVPRSHKLLPHSMFGNSRRWPRGERVVALLRNIFHFGPAGQVTIASQRRILTNCLQALGKKVTRVTSGFPAGRCSNLAAAPGLPDQDWD